MNSFFMKTQQYCPALFCVLDEATLRVAGLMLITCRLIREYLLQTAVTRPYICLELQRRNLWGHWQRFHPHHHQTWTNIKVQKH